MRLNEYEIDSIKETFEKIFDGGVIILFGSRVDDDKKGGDIDLYLQPDNVQNLKEKKINFLIALKARIGEQKIDVIIAKDPNRIIELEAIEKGIKL